MEIYRKRFLPDECVKLKDDIIIENNEKYLITKWIPIKPRLDIKRGVSIVVFDKNIKISKIIDNNDEIVYYYIDIIVCDLQFNKIVTVDYLLDIIYYEDMTIKILDLEELYKAKEKNIISKNIFDDAIKYLNNALNLIYSKEILEYIDKIKNI